MDVILMYWQQIVAVIAFVVWAIRLESKVKANTSEMQRFEKHIREIENNRKEQRTEDMNQIHDTLVEIQGDIKSILLRQHGEN